MNLTLFKRIKKKTLNQLDSLGKTLQIVGL